MVLVLGRGNRPATGGGGGGLGFAEGWNVQDRGELVVDNNNEQYYYQDTNSRP